MFWVFWGLFFMVWSFLALVYMVPDQEKYPEWYKWFHRLHYTTILIQFSSIVLWLTVFRGLE